MFHNYETEKITRKAGDAAESLQYRVVRFFHPRSSCTTHISADVQKITLNASSAQRSRGDRGRTEQHVIGLIDLGELAAVD